MKAIDELESPHLASVKVMTLQVFKRPNEPLWSVKIAVWRDGRDDHVSRAGWASMTGTGMGMALKSHPVFVDAEELRRIKQALVDF